MRTRIVILFILGLLLVGLFSCTSKSARERVNQPTQVQQQLVQNNAERLKSEFQEIQAHIQPKYSTLLRTDEGIPYVIQKTGNGRGLSSDDTAVFSGFISDLSGVVLYDYQQKPIVMRVMNHPWPSAMQKVLLGMQVGEHRIAFIPASYAYGLSGDGDKIDSYCSIIINFHLDSFL